MGLKDADLKRTWRKRAKNRSLLSGTSECFFVRKQLGAENKVWVFAEEQEGKREEDVGTQALD